MQDRYSGQAKQPLLTASQVQERLGVDRSTVYRMALDGRLGAVKVGKQWRFPASGIESLLGGGATQAQKPSTPAVLALIEVAADELGVMMVVTDMNGQPLTGVANPCPWFTERGDSVLDACVADWRHMADEVRLTPEFSVGPFGFECARAYIRSGNQLVGMVLAGGVAAPGGPAGMYELDDAARARVLQALPRVAAALSRRDSVGPAATGIPREQ